VGYLLIVVAYRVILNSVKRADSGVYECHVANEDGSEHIARRTLHVNVKRHQEVEPDDYVDNEEEELDKQISCDSVQNDDLSPNSSYVCFDLNSVKRMSHMYVNAAGTTVNMNCIARGISFLNNWKLKLDMKWTVAVVDLPT
jgi:hypothetical protein